jgi:hypothetical protein
MDRDELWRSILLIVALLALTVLAAQSSRNCDVPGSTFVPCVSFKVLWNSMHKGANGKTLRMTGRVHDGPRSSISRESLAGQPKGDATIRWRSE